MSECRAMTLKSGTMEQKGQRNLLMGNLVEDHTLPSRNYGRALVVGQITITGIPGASRQ
jgi:hypothetical protein